MTTENSWNAGVLPPNKDDEIWEIFHENSKFNKFHQFPPQDYIQKQMKSMWTSLPMKGRPRIELPSPKLAFDMNLAQTITSRVSGRFMERCEVSLQSISDILFCGYGETRANANNGFPRPFRTVPSGGGLYPIEIYVHIAKCPELESGLYHYHSPSHSLALIKKGDMSRDIGSALIQPNIPLESSLMILMGGFFERSTFKYGARGYRFVFIEAGHIAQNINLASNALGLGVQCIGGYQDRIIDELLGFDGIRSSSIYLMGIGRLISDPTHESPIAD